MAVPPVWMFMIAAAATAVVVSVGIIAYNHYQDSQRQKTKAYGATRRRNPGTYREPGPHGLCKVCIDENATIQFLPCKHVLMCPSCFQEYYKKEDRCSDINCRRYIENIERIS